MKTEIENRKGELKMEIIKMNGKIEYTVETEKNLYKVLMPRDFKGHKIYSIVDTFKAQNENVKSIMCDCGGVIYQVFPYIEKITVAKDMEF